MSKVDAAISIDSEDDELSFVDDDEGSDFSFDQKVVRKNNLKVPTGKSSFKKTTKSNEQSKPPPAILKEKSVNSVPKSREKTIEETYQKKTQLEHILLRPDTYSKHQRRKSSYFMKIITQNTETLFPCHFLNHSWIC